MESANFSPRIALIAPQAPHPGGISDHATALGAALEAHSPLLRVSYANLFPRLIYPGDYKSDMRGRDDLPDHTRFLIEYNRPGTWREAAQAIETFKADVAIFAWWNFFLAAPLRAIARRLRKRGIRSVFLCHNLNDHEAAWWKKGLSRWCLRNADGFVTHSPEDAEGLRQIFTDKPVLQTPHPVYAHYPQPGTAPSLPSGQTRFLMLGYVRPYKGVDVLADALASGHFDGDHFLISGEWLPARRMLQDNLSKRANVTVEDRFLSQQEIADRCGWADALVLPYRHATGSGIAATALHFRKPIVTTRTGALPEVVDDGKTGYLAEPGDAKDLIRALKTCREDLVAGRDFTEPITHKAASLTWERMALTLRTFFREELPIGP